METQIRRLNERLRRLLKRHFPGAEVNALGPGGPQERIGGVLVWSGFGDMDPAERQSALWSLLRERLARAEQLRISLIMTLTPDERDAIHGNSQP